jgi:Chaperone of endosialidase
MKSKIRLKATIRSFTVVGLALFGFALLPSAHAVVPAPDGGYPNFTTAEGTNALQNLTTGAGNTGVGWYSLFTDTTASFNTGVGGGTLVFNNADSNTAIGVAALLFNTNRDGNTAVGVSALQSNTEGFQNTAIGRDALLSNTSGDDNTATGLGALYSNTTGFSNAATGFEALYSNTSGGENTAIGRTALSNNTEGERNTAVGTGALDNNIDGDDNTAIGNSAGSNITGSGNVCIGAGVNGFAGESNITRIRNVYESVTTDRAVYVTADGRIGTLSSSRRYKEGIEPMNRASETLFALKPVTFRYKKTIDPASLLSFGLIAEDVAEISPDLITRDKNGKPQTVRYEAVNAMLLNEFLKEHRKGEQQDRKIEEQEARIAKQQKQIHMLMAMVKEQAAQIQKVSARLEVNKGVQQMVSE